MIRAHIVSRQMISASDGSYDLKPIGPNQTVIDMNETFTRLNDFITSPSAVLLEKFHGTTHVSTAWEQIGQKLIEMHEIADRLRAMEKAA